MSRLQAAFGGRCSGTKQGRQRIGRLSLLFFDESRKWLEVGTRRVALYQYQYPFARSKVGGT